jgi:hypothetical protein
LAVVPVAEPVFCLITPGGSPSFLLGLRAAEQSVDVAAELVVECVADIAARLEGEQGVGFGVLAVWCGHELPSRYAAARLTVSS